MKWFEHLKSKWNLKSSKQLILILIVFACTGFTVLFIKKPLFDFLGINQQKGIFKTIVYLIAILPLYQILLLFYGFVFGQFKFFWEFEKKMIRRLLGKK